MADEIEPISPERAQEILDAAIRERLGDNWDDEDSGWTKVTGHNYMARVTRGRTNLDFYVDLLGSVTVEQTNSAPLLETGRLMLVMLIGLSIVIAFLIVRIVVTGG